MYRTTSALPLLALLLAAVDPGQAQEKPAAAAVVTYDQVVRHLKLGMNEETILELLEDSPTHFTLGKEQVKELQRVGASERLIEAMRKKAAGQKHDESISDFAVILDVSGSMRELTTEGKPKWDAAQRGAIDLIETIPSGCRLTFIVYGHDVELKCEAVHVFKPLGLLTSSEKASIKEYVGKLKPAGHTPIALALRKAGTELAKNQGVSKVILITDGIETCHGDPAKEAAELLAGNRRLKAVDVVGFGLKAKEIEEVTRIARAGKGKYYDAQSAHELRSQLAVLRKELEKEARPAVPAKPPEETKVARIPVKRVQHFEIKVLEPEIRLPAMNSIHVLPAGTNPNVYVKSDTVAKTDKYGEPLRVPVDQAVDVYWQPKEGKWQLLAEKLSSTEPQTIEIRVEGRLGMIRVAGKDLPEPKRIKVWKAGDGRGRVTTEFQIRQESDRYGVDMAIRPGVYDVWLQSATDKKARLLAEKVEVKPGKVVVIE
jgi:hypothetical protein